jgi:Flp pilus assembly secretin CpaC
MHVSTARWVTTALLLFGSSARAVEGLPWVLTSGWPAVLDVEGLRSVTVEDPTRASAVLLDDDQLLLVGGVPGQTSITVVSEIEGRLDTVHRGLTVVRGQTFFEQTDLLRAKVAEPRRVRVPGLARVVSGDATLCEVGQVAPDELELLPRRPGVALVLLWAGGSTHTHRRRLLVDITSGVSRSVDDDDAVATEPVDGRLSLIAGESALLAVPQLTRVGVADPSVLRVRVAADGALLVEGLAGGATHLLLWMADARPQRRFVVVLPHTAAPPPVDEEAPLPPPLTAPSLDAR